MKTLRAIIWVGVLVVLSAPAAYSCSCNTPSLRKSLKGAEAVFVGTVVDVGATAQFVKAYEGTKLYPIKLKVETSWKGVKESEVVTILSNQSFVCGFIFQTSRQYLVYAYGGERVVINGCARSGGVSDDVRRLNSRWFRFTSYLNPF